MTDASGEHCFSFLAKAKPASLYKLLGKLDDGEAATVLAHLPPLLTAQAMAYYPEERQPGLLAGMRQARRADPERAVAVAEKIRAMLARLKAEAPRSSRSPGSLAPANDSGAPAPAPAPRPDRSPLSPRGVVASAYGKTPAKPPSSGQSDQPQPWKPRVTDATPINAPAKPGRPPAVAGPPSKSPLAKLNIFELLGFSKKDAETDKTPPGNRRAPPRDAAGKPAPARPPAREGTVASRKVRTADTPRVLGAGKAPAAPERPERPNASRSGAAPGGRGGGKKIDGMAILAAILREAPMDVRQNVLEDSPALFKALKERMFVFDDLNFSDQAALAQVFTAAPVHTAALALRFASPALRERALAAVSPRRAAMIRQEERSAQAGTSGLGAIEAAQARVLDVALRLQSAGRIVIDPRDPDLAG